MKMPKLTTWFMVQTVLDSMAKMQSKNTIGDGRRLTELAWRRNGDQELYNWGSSVDQNLDEFKACIGFGFGFDSPNLVRKLFDTLPTLDLYYAVNKQYSDSISKSSSSATPSKCDPSSPPRSPHTIFSPGVDPRIVKARLKQWAQVVACSLWQPSH
ncbi:uncharacterized protein LOC122654959 [Telopea speciosissima]|uniref:uncharacterized protein LOC122654959 n=1 Tax=Telopea speciosissima TaxID=54955 RepID=UPI001CC3A526|nr:uncharacterized protein LOC122654959 [Telopea speciosissima]